MKTASGQYIPKAALPLRPIVHTVMLVRAFTIYVTMRNVRGLTHTELSENPDDIPARK